MKLYSAGVLAHRQEEGLALRRGADHIFFQDPAMGRLAIGLLKAFQDGAEPETLLGDAPPDLRANLNALIDQMRRRGFLDTDPAASQATPEQVFWADRRFDAAMVRKLAAEVSPIVVGRNALSLAIARSLAEQGFGEISFVDDPLLRGRLDRGEADVAWRAADGFEVEAPNAALLIAVTDIGADAALRPWNAFAIERGVDFLPVSLRDGVIQIGPFTRRDEGPCLECARGRLNSHLHDVQAVRAGEAERASAIEAFGWHPALLPCAAALTLGEALRFRLGTLDGAAPGVLRADPFGSGETTRHRVLRLPRCPVCSPLRQRSAPLVVEDEAVDAELRAAFT